MSASSFDEVRLTTFRLTLALTILLTANTQAQTEKPDASLTANPVFQQNCAKCHGKTAEGRHFAGPSLVSEKATSTSADDLRTIITNGKHHMPKFAGKLTPADIDALVEQIKVEQIKAVKKP
jgi:mono/diheme cytochrome c family protein